jgi:dipeptidyl aminopeptidase/acylaminoacyl peptidase
MKQYKKLISLFAVLFYLTSLNAQQVLKQDLLPEYQPDRNEMLERYRAVTLLDSAVKNTVFRASVQANWQQGGAALWYRNILKDSVAEYIYVDVIKGTKRHAFDAEKMAATLSTATGKTLDGQRLPISKMEFDNNAGKVSLELEKKFWQVDLNNYSVQAIDSLPKDTIRYPGLLRNRGRWMGFRTPSTSPDKQWEAYIKDGNVFVKNKENEVAIQFTSNGSEKKPYGSLAWSPDSKYVVGYLITPYEDSVVNYVLTSQPNTNRGQLRSQQYKQPGDPFTTYEMYLFDLEKKRSAKVNTEIIDFFSAPVLRWRKDDSRYFLFERPDRGHQRFRITEVDAFNASAKNIIDEKTNTFIYEQRIFTHYLPETNEIIWTSEKDGWRHIYLVNSLTGVVKKQITKGDWVVKDIDSVDAKKREIWFRANGMNANEDPYYVHYYRIGFDGRNLVSLTPEEGNHYVSFSPDKKYFIDTYSQVNVPPVIGLKRTSDGKKVLELERAEITRYLATGITLPEPFHAKARDGITDIWGVVFRPSRFDETKRYPVIENIYAGPQDAFVPKSFFAYGEMQSMAELGFIVVQIDGMGTANRSKAFHDVCWKNLADAGFEDRILWIKALAAKYPYVNDTKVGLYGTSAGGQNSLGGLLFHPEFYKAAVSACGCHDNRVDKQWWNEQWMGYPVATHYDEQSNVTNAGKLQGDLLLIVGEADTNVPPESTYRVADALIKAGKSFDFLAIPGMGHSDGGAYGRVKKRDFFVKSLLGIDAPQRNTNELSVTK